MSIPTWGLIFVVLAVVIWAYLAASQWLDDQEGKHRRHR